MYSPDSRRPIAAARGSIQLRQLALLGALLAAAVLLLGLNPIRALAVPPTVTNVAALGSDVTDTQAVLTGTVATGSALTDCHFEYYDPTTRPWGGTTANFSDLSSGGTVPCATSDGTPIGSPGAIPADSTPHTVTATVPVSWIHAPRYYQLVAANADGSASPPATRWQGTGFGAIGFDGNVLDGSGNPQTQAGSHPATARTTFFIPARSATNGAQNQIEDLEDASVDLPPGLIGNPQATATCTAAQLETTLAGAACPLESQVGYVRTLSSAPTGDVLSTYLALFAIETPSGTPALFGFNFLNTIGYLSAEVRTGSDYGITIRSRNTPTGIALYGVEVGIWGTPADPANDLRRGVDGTSACADPNYVCPAHPSTAPRVPLITLPTSCLGSNGVPGDPLETRLHITSWQGGEDRASFLSHDNAAPTPNPIGVTGCDSVPFDPSLSVKATTGSSGSPSGLELDLQVPQDGLDDPDALATSHLKRAVVTLPEGMTVNPASASGLEGCSPAEIGLDSASPADCPETAKVGTMEIETPLLDHPVHGAAYLAEQSSFEGSLIALYLVAHDKESGVVLKVPGKVVPDPETGRLTATFDNQPQLPFSSLHLSFKDGPRAPLVTPATCGTYATIAELTSWSGQTVESSSSFSIGQGPDGGPCVARGFSPGFDAGTVSPVAGVSSDFNLRLFREDSDQELSGVSVDLPQGLLARISQVRQCADGQAAAGSCGEVSRIGSVTAGAGAGPLPYYITSGRAYLTGPYKGAPFGLSIVVPAVAGPFDLGTVVVRSALHVDPRTAQVRVVSDPFPRILEGIPLQVRDVRVDVDRPDFILNPTSCAEKRIGARATSTEGAAANVSSRFQVGDCAALAFRPRLALRLTGKGRTRTGAHPGLKSILTQGSGQANIAKAQVTLPKSVVLDPRNSTDPALVCDYDKAQQADCPASSVIGKATARTPLLNRLLSGNVHLVQGIRFGPTGNRIRTTPSLLVKLRGEVSINLYARTTVRNNRLVTVFDQVPDAQVSRFDLQINGGRKGILVITRTAKSNINICRSKQTAAIKTNGQNGRQSNYKTNIKTPCAKKAKKAKRETSKKKK